MWQTGPAHGRPVGHNRALQVPGFIVQPGDHNIVVAQPSQEDPERSDDGFAASISSDQDHSVWFATGAVDFRDRDDLTSFCTITGDDTQKFGDRNDDGTRQYNQPGTFRIRKGGSGC